VLHSKPCSLRLATTSVPALLWAGDEDDGVEWYLIRTKPGKEQAVRDQLAQSSEVFLPLRPVRRKRLHKFVWCSEPLFRCYVFVRFDLDRHSPNLKHMPGVRHIVPVGADPVAVPEFVISEIRRHASANKLTTEEHPAGDVSEFERSIALMGLVADLASEAVKVNANI
jgi:transcription antitermination factor NusG